MKNSLSGSLRRYIRWIVAWLLVACSMGVHAADIYGYIDDKGVAHFASEKLDARYQIFFRGGQSFDTADGIGPLARRGVIGGKVPKASQTLMSLFEASPSYKVAKAALRDASRKHAIDYELLQALVATESGFDAQAVSPKGALGLMQVLPATAQRYGVSADKRNTIEKKLFDPRINIATGTRYLHDLIAMFPGEIELALAAYNAGEGAVQRAGNKIPNYRETQDYVKTVLQLYAYLKPSVALGGGRTPGRIRMQIGGAIGRGNMPPVEPQDMPAMPELRISPYMPRVPGRSAPITE
ncbi:Membrane-bound lytic murein transglycosylase C precursor [Variovorax sp. SRS16]|uniref:lytic transglycosylase domain-containing protein n=1 Tax=Variovorax sp. SRS16 TaxID=282217 RepID=UPI0013192280|nr:lytic transglycosylase domain-containing protein [Variovorax sp. SRS16]VTU22946.1 Membrane-bound lytic murein transglycosylase C precursor [Variovorax sp. SRS16]